MQDPTASITATAAFPQLKIPQFPEHEQLKCPRCDSNNTKFCYYNNYNLSQPRHYCKSCKRYWTKGGALRNIPVGGGTRKITKKSTSKKSSSAQTQLLSSALELGLAHETKPVSVLAPEVGTGLGLPSPAGERVGSFTSLLGMANEGQFGKLMVEGLDSNGLWLGQDDGPGQSTDSELMKGGGGSTSEGLIIGGVQDGGDQSFWTDLAIYTQPGSKY